MTADELERAIAPLLKQHGFQKSGRTWRKRINEVVAVFNIQKSRWGTDFYLNAGVYFVSLGLDRNPTENKCHIRERIHETEPEMIVATAIPWFMERSTLSSVARLVAADSLRGLVHVSVNQSIAT